MVLALNTLSAPRGRARRTRVGRGNASGHGTYSGRGQKGQKARTGGRRGNKRRGLKQFLGQLPKNRGFTSHYPKMRSVNVSVLEKRFTDGDLVTPTTLVQKGIIDSISGGVKILGGGVLKKRLTISAHGFSDSAEQAIRKAGGHTRTIT